MLSDEFKRSFTLDLNSKIPEYYQSILRITDEVKYFFDNDFSDKTTNYITNFEEYRAQQINALFQNIVDLFNVYFKLVLKFKNSSSSENFRFYIGVVSYTPRTAWNSEVVMYVCMYATVINILMDELKFCL